MKSDPKNICIDTAQFNRAYPQTRFEFHTHQRFGGSQLVAAIVDTAPLTNEAENKLENVWRVSMGGIDKYRNDGKVLKEFDDIKDRDSYNASYQTVLYACELGDNPTDEQFKTAPISDFMQNIADRLSAGLNDETPFYLNAQHDGTIERFERSKETGELVSLPHHKSEYIPVRSRNGLAVLEEYLGEHADRFRDAKYDSFLGDYITRTVKILQAANYKMNESSVEAQVERNEFKEQQDIICLPHVQRADAVLKFIREEKAQFPEPKPSWKPPRRDL